MTTYVEVVIPGSLEGDAAKARRLLRLACDSRRKADAREAVRALRLAASWVYGGDGWETLRRAADRIGLRLHQGQPWVRVAREQAAELDAMLRAMAGEEVGGG